METPLNPQPHNHPLNKAMHHTNYHPSSEALDKRNIKATFIYSEGTAEHLEISDIPKALERTDGFVWIHIHSATPQKIIYAIPNIPKYIARSLSASETRPRAEATPEGLLLNLRCLNPDHIHHENEPLEMISLRLWINEKIIVSVHRKPLEFMGKLLNQVNEDILVSNSMDILRLMLEAIIEVMSDLAIDLNEQMDLLEDSTEHVHDKRRKLSEHRREIISVRRYLIPQREALLRLPFDKLPWLNDLQKISLRESADSTTRILEDLESARDRANLLQEELMNATQEQINNKIFLLSIVAVIFMPLSFVTGLLGINVGGIPGVGNSISFWLVCGILLVLAISEIFVLKFLKWL